MHINGSQQSTTLSNSTDWLHNGRLDYRTPFGLKAGVELTYYRSPSDQLLNSRLLESDELDFFTQDCQRINRWKMFLAQEHSLGKGWGIELRHRLYHQHRQQLPILLRPGDRRATGR